MHKFISIITLAILLPSPAAFCQDIHDSPPEKQYITSALQFSNPTQEFHPEITADSITANFKFTNTSDKPIEITNVETGCGCTTAQSPDKPIEPDQSQNIAIKYNFKPTGGISTRSITIYTDEQNAQPIQLIIKVHIPQILTPDQRYVSWTGNSKPSPQIIKLKIGIDKPVNITDIKIKTLGRRSTKNKKAKPAPFTLELINVKSDTADYILKITPTDMTNPTGAEIKIITDFKSDNLKNSISLYAHILAPIPTQ